MTTAPQEEDVRPLRSDARRNRERILAAATELFVEQGIEVPLDAVARHADVGIATLYRRFPDRDALAGAVAREAFTSVHRLAVDCIAVDGDGVLRRFLLGVADLRVGVLMASLLPVLAEVSDEEGLAGAFDGMVEAVTALADRAKQTGELRADATAEDVMLLLAMMTRPLQGIPSDYCEAVIPRLLHILLEGLEPASRASTPLPAPPPAPNPGQPPSTTFTSAQSTSASPHAPR